MKINRDLMIHVGGEVEKLFDAYDEWLSKWLSERRR